ncbi:amidohydrolase family protein [Candidatus Woesearchaeota archaeon]|nr:amidohydrolase family protein [Candidatus Woesearchaeota archaeon]
MIITDARILENGVLVKKDILIIGGKIKKIAQGIDSDEKIINAEGLIAIPGIIDSHVHFRDFEQKYKEDFFTGSCAAAAGGITSVLDMPNNKPPVLSVDDLNKKRELAKKSVVNYGFYFGTDGNNIPEIKKAKNIAAVKVYMERTTGNLAVENVENVFKNCKRIAVHAEGKNVSKAIELAKKYNNYLYLCHISTKEEIEIIKREKSNKIFAEATPHHLFLKSNNTPFCLMKPELKSAADVKALWDGIDLGIIDTIGSDHAPHAVEEKKSGGCYGIPGVETLLPLLLNAINEKRLTLKKVIQLCCENPVRIFGIKNKGFLKEGYDADIVLVDINRIKEVKNSGLFTKCKWSPFDGMKLRGWPVMTIVNGNVVFDNGKINDIKGKKVVFSR